MATSTRFLLSEEGKSFLNDLGALMQRFATDPTTNPYSYDVRGPNGKRRDVQPNLSPAAAWDEVLVAFRQGLFGVADVPDDEKVHLGPEFDRRLTEIYWERFSDTFGTANLGLMKAQAIILGQLTANVYQLKKGELRGGNYPATDANTELSVSHLDWARDVLGFWLAAKNRWRISTPRDGAPFQFASVAFEFENGCTLC